MNYRSCHEMNARIPCQEVKGKQEAKSDYLDFRARLRAPPTYRGCRTRKLEIGHAAGAGLVEIAMQLYHFFCESVSLALLAAVILHNEDAMRDRVC
jgi:hypothetical protein